MALLADLVRRVVGLIRSRISAADTRGSTTTLFAVLAPVLILLAAGGTQYSVLVVTKERIQSIADSAALGAAKQLNLSSPIAGTATSAAIAIAKAQLTGGTGVVDKVGATLVDSNSGVDVTIARTLPSLFGSLLNPSIFTVSAHSRAHATGGPPLCALALDPKVQGAVTLDTSAVVDARGCEVYSDSKSNLSINADQSAILKTAYTCAVGGKKGNFPNFAPQPKSGCPSVADPLASRPQPSVGLLCDQLNFGCKYQHDPHARHLLRRAESRQQARWQPCSPASMSFLAARWWSIRAPR